VTSGLGITASPVSAAMAAYLVLMEAKGFGLPQVLAITVPSAIVACIVTSFVQQRIGKELIADPVFRKRVEAGTVEVPAALEASFAAPASAGAEAAAGSGSGAGSSATAARLTSAGAAPVEHTVPPGGRTAAWIFIVGTLLVVALGLFPALRPAFPDADGTLVPIGMSPVIEMVMFTVALVIILAREVKPSLVVEQPLLLAVALFLVAGLTTSQSATTNTLIPIALAAGLAPGVVTAMWPSLIGVWLFPANGSQIAAVETDRTGSTRLTPVPIWNSFTIPMLVSWVSVVVSGLLIQLVIPS